MLDPNYLSSGHRFYYVSIHVTITKPKKNGKKMEKKCKKSKKKKKQKQKDEKETSYNFKTKIKSISHFILQILVYRLQFQKVLLKWLD